MATKIAKSVIPQNCGTGNGNSTELWYARNAQSSASSNKRWSMGGLYSSIACGPTAVCSGAPGKRCIGSALGEEQIINKCGRPIQNVVTVIRHSKEMLYGHLGVRGAPGGGAINKKG